MDEYINKNVLYEKIAQLEELARNRYLDTPSLYYPMYMTQLDERTHFKHIIADFPAEDVEPVRHGRWIDAREYCGDYMCSNCEALYGTNKFNYCPNCGAKMDGGDENG